MKTFRQAADKNLPPLTLPSPLLVRCAGRGEGTIESADRLTPHWARVLGLIAALATIVWGRALWADALVVTQAMKASTIAEIFVD